MGGMLTQMEEIPSAKMSKSSSACVTNSGQSGCTRK